MKNRTHFAHRAEHIAGVENSPWRWQPTRPLRTLANAAITLR
jgi:hypothetical protein